MDEYRLRAEGKAEEERHEWERARWQMYMVVQMHPYLKQKPKTPQEWVKFPWEIEKPQEGINWQTSEEEAQRVREIFKHYKEKHG